jgi:hypothetical protein
MPGDERRRCRVETGKQAGDQVLSGTVRKAFDPCIAGTYRLRGQPVHSRASEQTRCPVTRLAGNLCTGRVASRTRTGG